MRLVALMSGGLDSTTAVAMRARGAEIYPLVFHYGQRHEIEIMRAYEMAQHFGCKPVREVKVNLAGITENALTGSEPVPKTPTDGIPATFVPGRNLIFLSFALTYAEHVGAKAILTGVNAVDYSGYPDCRPEFIAAFEAAARLAVPRSVYVDAPLIRLTKLEIVRMARRFEVPIDRTWSCYNPASVDGETIPCEACDSCRIRNKALTTLDAGV